MRFLLIRNSKILADYDGDPGVVKLHRGESLVGVSKDFTGLVGESILQYNPKEFTAIDVTKERKPPAGKVLSKVLEQDLRIKQKLREMALKELMEEDLRKES